MTKATLGAASALDEVAVWPGRLLAPPVGPLFDDSHPIRMQRSLSQPDRTPFPQPQPLPPARSASLPGGSLPLAHRHRDLPPPKHVSRVQAPRRHRAAPCPLLDRLPFEVLHDISRVVVATGGGATWVRVHPRLAAVGQTTLLRHMRIESIAALRTLVKTLDESPEYYLAAGRCIRTLTFVSPVVPPYLCCGLVRRLAEAQQLARGVAGALRLELDHLRICFAAFEAACPHVAQLLVLVAPRRLEWLSSPCWSVSLHDLTECLGGFTWLESLTLGGFLVDTSLVRELSALVHVSELHLLGWHDSNTISVRPAVLEALLSASTMQKSQLARVSLAGCSTSHAALLAKSVEKSPSSAPCAPTQWPFPPKSACPWTSHLPGNDTIVITRSLA